MHADSLQPAPAIDREPPLAFLERRRRPLALAALIGALAGGVTAQLLPSRYQATAHLVIVPADDPTGPNTTGALDLANATLPVVVAVLHSARLADAVVARLGLASAWHLPPAQAALRLSRQLDVATDRKSNLVTVSTEDRLPRRARDIVAAVTDEATALGSALWSARNRVQRQRLEGELADVRAKLAAAEEALRDFRQRTHVVDLAAQVKASVEQAAAIERLYIDKSLGVRFTRGFGDGDAVEVRRATRERDAVAHELGGLRHGAARPGPILSLDELPALEVEHARLQRAIDELGARQQMLALKVAQLRAAEARPGGSAEVIDPPVEPTRRSGPSRLRYAGLGGLVAALATALALLWAARRRRPFVVQ